MVDSLGDQFSGYLTPEAYESSASQLSGEFEGIGVYIRTLEETGEIEVVSIIEGSPALAAGVQPGDIFWEVDGRSTAGLNQTELAGLVRGPVNSDVTIVFRRDEDFVEIVITRARIEIPTVTTDILDNDIAYIKLSEFSSVAADRMEQAIQELDINSRNGFVLDLRGNPGGLLTSAVEIGSLFHRRWHAAVRIVRRRHGTRVRGQR